MPPPASSGSSVDNEYASLSALYGPGLSIQDMRMRKYGGPTVPAKSVNDLEYAYWGAGTTLSNADKKLAYVQTLTGKTGQSIDDLTSLSIGAGAPAVLTNLCTNPTPGNIIGWDANYPTDFIQTYAANEISVNRQATALASYVSSNAVIGGIANIVLPTGANYQRSVEIWTDLPSAVIVGGILGAFVGNNFPLVQNTWTRVIEQVIGTGTLDYVMGINVAQGGYNGTGIHVKYRKAQLIANPSGTTQPYFDGSTTDTASMDYAWTGVANASTSTATPK